MKNTFQALIESPDISLYSTTERLQKTHILSASYLDKKVIPALIKAADQHIAKRHEAIIKRARGNTSFPFEIALVVEALSDSHFRKQQKYGPSKEEIAQKVSAALRNKEPIQLVGLMFTRKNVCPLKRGPGDESSIDLAEIISFIHLNSFAKLISTVYPYGVTFTILSEGRRFIQAFDLCEPYVRSYQQKLKKLIVNLDLKHLTLIDYEDFLEDHISPETKQRRAEEYIRATHLYRDLMIPLFNPLDMHQTLHDAINADPIKDSRNNRNNFIPLWDSIKNSLPYPEISHFASIKSMEYETAYRFAMKDLFTIKSDATEEMLRRSILSRSWYAAIEHSARVMADSQAALVPEKYISPYAFRTSVNPKPGAHLGIYTMRETTSRVQPWHGTALLQLDSTNRITGTVLSKLELESKGYLPVSIETQENHVFYASSNVVDIMSKDEIITFNMATRDVKISL